MNKASTLTFFTYLQKFLLVSVIILASAVAQPNIAGVEKPVFKSITAKSIKCYPNPAISFVNFEFPSDYIGKDYSLQVFSFTGKKMYEAGVSNAKITLTFNNEFYRGIYVFQLHDKAGKIIEAGKFQVTK